MLTAPRPMGSGGPQSGGSPPGVLCTGLLLLVAFLVAFAGSQITGAGPQSLVLATTTSTQDTGLLDLLVPRFEKQTGLKLKVIAVGTGQALELGRRGDADVLLVHAPSAERKFMDEGHGESRKRVFYNDFVLVGPEEDPARVRKAGSLTAAMAAIARPQGAFISRGDDSGTHQKEQALWKLAGREPEGKWYLSAGAGMAEALRMASEKRAYTLADRGTFLALSRTLKLRVLYEGSPDLRNPYTVIVVNPGKHPGVNAVGARRLAAFLLQPETRRLIGEFGESRFGQPLFHTWSFPE